MKRREFIAGLSGAAAWPLAVRAQQPDRVRRIGWLTSLAADDPQSLARVTAFVQELQKLGWTVGRNLRIDYRFGASTYAITLVNPDGVSTGARLVEVDGMLSADGEIALRDDGGEHVVRVTMGALDAVGTVR